MESRRMFGLSYSSMDIPRDNRRPLLTPAGTSPLPSWLLCDIVLCRSIPGIVTDVSKPKPLQKRRMAWATLAG